MTKRGLEREFPVGAFAKSANAINDYCDQGAELRAWISSRYQPAAVAALNDGSLSPIMDFFWIVPGIFFEFTNPPAGYTTELTLMDTDGTHLQQLTSDNQVVADNQWSEDGRRIIFRQTSGVTASSRIRLLTFDDCR